MLTEGADIDMVGVNTMRINSFSVVAGHRASIATAPIRAAGEEA
jgi:hypothetical protein